MNKTLDTLLHRSGEKGLASLLVGGNAAILLGVPRLTVDIDLLVPLAQRSQWLDLMRELGFRLLHGSEAFAQLNPGTPDMVPVDLMFVDAATWSNMDAVARQESVSGRAVRIPRVEHFVALKLHAASSASRGDARERDWDDIRQIVRAWHLDPSEPYFREVILRQGGAEALNRILQYRDEA